ncbi:MAG: hypothetical protein JXA71_04270 [Chitinispirillaceae bacterium]|nr:hypothetical protein [Chitinispirillaceae bacterium]
MPELNVAVPFFRSEKGAVLAPIIAFSVLIILAIGGFMGLARNVINLEIAELNDDRAFLAAESGLLIGTRWLRDQANWNQYHQTGYSGPVYQGTVNSLSVTVTITKEPNGDLLIQSIASGGELRYSKALSWTVTPADWSDPGVFINDLSQVGGVGGGGLNNEWFDGPVHSNSPIRISSVSGGEVNVKFVNGKVTVHNRTDQVPFANGGHWGNYGTSSLSGNNYDFGIWHHDAQAGQWSKLDPLFLHNGMYSPFQHSKDSLFMPPVTGQTRTLPQNQSANNRAILHFDVLNGTTGQATYYYYDAAGQQLSLSFNNGNEVIRVPNDVFVLGTVKGQTTVITDAGRNIYPAGDIMYHGYQPDVNDMDAYSNTDNYGLGGLTPLNNDVLALVAGGDISFGLNKHQFSLQGGVASLSAISAQGQNLPTMYVTAQLIAAGQDHGIRWESTNVNQYNYRLRALGTRAVDVYEESHNAQGGPGSDAFRFFYDTRFKAGLKSPGVPSLRASSSSGDLFILNTNWREENLL